MFFARTFAIFSIATIALTLLAVPAGATLTYYSRQSAWLAATSNVFTINFDDPAVTTYADYTTTGLQIGGVTFTGQDLLRVYDADWAGSGHGVPAAWTGDYLMGSGWGKYVQVTLPANVYAVAAEVFSIPFGYQMSFSFSTNESYGPVATLSNDKKFVGFVSDQPLQWVRLSAATGYTAMDNFSYSQMEMEATPESSSLLLAGLGLASLLVARRLRRP